MATNVNRAGFPVLQPEPPIADAYAIHRYGRFWQVLDPGGDLVCLTVYKRGAKEVVRRLCAGIPSSEGSAAMKPY
jgi:hypothetical protein